jgi:CRP/FNR family transcriptional regulator, polysaccharide utilization system transcription regulator
MQDLASDLQCRNCIDHENSVFNVLSADQKNRLLKNSACRAVKKGEIIFTEGDVPAGLISLSKGKVKVFIEGIGGKEQIVRLASPIGFIGYRALFAQETHKATAVAMEDSVICVINKESLFAVMQENSQLPMKIIRSFATELGFTINRTVTLTQKHIRGRLAESLKFLIDTYGLEKDGSTIKVYFSREDIANLSCMTTSNAIRTLSSFAHEGVISLEGKKIKILDFERLENISDIG